ncbi:alpha/beta-hydrolase, partial [Ophiobolus disseminans]
ELSIPVRDGTSIRGVLYKPKEEAKGPLVVYFHGGGMVFGSPEAGERYFEPLVKELGCSVVSVGYRLAPECVFPTGAQDAIDAVHWCVKNAATLGAEGIIVAGSSAGGCLATVAAHQLVDDGLGEQVRGVVLLSPNLLHHAAVPDKYKPHYNSYEEFKDGLILDRAGIEWFDDYYKPDPQSSLASPLLWISHEGQPRTYLQVTGADPLRDEALIYEHVLREHGVETKLDVSPGIPHGGPDFLFMHSCAGRAVQDLKRGVEWIRGAEKV